MKKERWTLSDRNESVERLTLANVYRKIAKIKKRQGAHDVVKLFSLDAPQMRYNYYRNVDTTIWKKCHTNAPI